MGEIEIKICIGQEAESIYRFTEFPVEIGRSQDCQLSIHHEAVARKLCRVWIEPSGLIHVEEHPNLTNPILENGKKIQNGVAKPSVSLRVGPVTLDIRNLSATLAPEKSVRFRPPWIAAVTILGAMLLLSFMWRQNRRDSEQYTTMVSAFPRAVALQPPTPLRGADVPTDMLIQLAQTEFMRLPEDVHRKKRAIQLIWRAEKHGPPQSSKTQRCRAFRMTWTAELNSAYRLELVRLQNALKSRNAEATRESAGRLQPYLSNTNRKLIAWLRSLEKKGAEQ